MCDTHIDALSCLQSAISRGFKIESLHALAQLYIDHKFITEEEADSFLSEIPVIGERDDEPQGPTGTGKPYLLNGLIELMWSCRLVVAKLAPSGQRCCCPFHWWNYCLQLLCPRHSPPPSPPPTHTFLIMWCTTMIKDSLNLSLIRTVDHVIPKSRQGQLWTMGSTFLVVYDFIWDSQVEIFNKTFFFVFLYELPCLNSPEPYQDCALLLYNLETSCAITRCCTI